MARSRIWIASSLPLLAMTAPCSYAAARSLPGHHIQAIAHHLTAFSAREVICPSRYCVAAGLLALTGKSLAPLRAIPRPIRGALRIVIDVGRGERWTRATQQTNAPLADGEA